MRKFTLILAFFSIFLSDTSSANLTNSFKFEVKGTGIFDVHFSDNVVVKSTDIESGEILFEVQAKNGLIFSADITAQSESGKIFYPYSFRQSVLNANKKAYYVAPVPESSMSKINWQVLSMKESPSKPEQRFSLSDLFYYMHLAKGYILKGNVLRKDFEMLEKVDLSCLFVYLRGMNYLYDSVGIVPSREDIDIIEYIRLLCKSEVITQKTKLHEEFKILLKRIDNSRILELKSLWGAIKYSKGIYEDKVRMYHEFLLIITDSEISAIKITKKHIFDAITLNMRQALRQREYISEEEFELYSNIIEDIKTIMVSTPNLTTSMGNALKEIEPALHQKYNNSKKGEKNEI